MSRLRARHLGYLLFGLVLLYVLFWWQFPCDQVRKAAVQSLEEFLPARVSLGNVRLSFPFTLHLENLRLESGPVVFRFPNLVLIPEPWQFLRGRTVFRIVDSGKLPRVRGEYRLQKTEGRIDLRLENLAVPGLFQGEFAFRLKASGEASFQWDGDAPDRRNGKAWLMLERGPLDGSGNPPFLLSFLEKVRTEFQIQQGVLHIQRLEVNGREMPGAFSGDGLSDLGSLLQTPKRD